MTQERDQYVYFTIKLLKGSFALNALWQDALNYHMIDQPDKLIALRLTEYYELVAKGVMRPGPSIQGQGGPGAPNSNSGHLENLSVPSLPPNNPSGRLLPPQQYSPTTVNSNGNGNGRFPSPQPTPSMPAVPTTPAPDPR